MAYQPVSHIRTKQVFLTSTGEGQIPVAGFVTLGSSGDVGSPGGGSTQVSVKQILTSSGASVMDSTESAIKVNVVAGAAGGSTLATVRQSTVGDLRVSVYQSTLGDLRANAYQSTVGDLRVSVYQSTLGDLRSNAYQSTQADLRVTSYQSTAGNFLVTGYQSTAADLNAAVVQGSTTWQTQCSTLGGAVIVRSSAADMQVTAAQASTTWAVQLTQYSTTANVSSVSGLVRVSDESASTFTYGQVTLNTTAAVVVAASTARIRVVIVQQGAVAAYLGASTVSTGTGVLLSSVAGYPMVFRHTAAISGITSASTTIVSYYQELRQ